MFRLWLLILNLVKACLVYGYIYFKYGSNSNELLNLQYVLSLLPKLFPQLLLLILFIILYQYFPYAFFIVDLKHIINELRY